jgi:hypothetical protein
MKKFLFLFIMLIFSMVSIAMPKQVDTLRNDSNSKIEYKYKLVAIDSIQGILCMSSDMVRHKRSPDISTIAYIKNTKFKTFYKAQLLSFKTVYIRDRIAINARYNC